MLCKTEDQRKIWASVEEQINKQPTDGLDAWGVYSESAATHQRSFILGLRAARLAALNAISPPTKDTGII
jgi:hypothetical protein